jgi:hypothetical protein
MEAKMPEKKSSPYVVKHSIVLPLKMEQIQIPFPLPTWPGYLYEYDSPVIWFPQGPSEWNIDVSFANRSALDQLGYIFTTNWLNEPDQPVSAHSPLTCPSGRIVDDEWNVQMPSGSPGSGLWLRLFVTSLDLIPSVHVNAIRPVLNSSEFYFSPGDFAFFVLPGGYIPPGLRPPTRIP